VIVIEGRKASIHAALVRATSGQLRFLGLCISRAIGAVLPAVGALPASLPPLSAPSLDAESVRAVASGVIA
jgi:hypothetical protein